MVVSCSDDRSRKYSKPQLRIQTKIMSDHLKAWSWKKLYHTVQSKNESSPVCMHFYSVYLLQVYSSANQKKNLIMYPLKFFVFRHNTNIILWIKNCLSFSKCLKPEFIQSVSNRSQLPLFFHPRNCLLSKLMAILIFVGLVQKM